MGPSKKQLSQADGVLLFEMLMDRC
jgi:hypothetical protein